MAALRRLVNYNHTDEQRDYEEQDDNGRQSHIFTDIVVLARMLARVDASEVLERSVMVHGIQTEEQWRDLERELGLALYGLGRWKEWAAGDPKLLTDRYDLDAAITWARARGLTYEVETNVRYTPGQNEGGQ